MTPVILADVGFVRIKHSEWARIRREREEKLEQQGFDGQVSSFILQCQRGKLPEIKPNTNRFALFMALFQNDCSKLLLKKQNK